MLPRPRDLVVGDVVDGKYRVVGTLGVGGMGTVFAVRRLALGDVAALKTLLPALDGSEPRRRFLREAQAAASIRHPNVVQVFDFGGGAMPYLVMELVEGPSLAEELRASGPMSIDRVVRLGAELCAAVEAGHRRGIVHRDLKPSNVMLAQQDDARETVKVLDFGIAKVESGPGADRDGPITDTGAILGTFQYLAPEQLRGESAGASSDVFALGVILFEMITGKLPFDGPNPGAVLFALAKGEHPSLRSLRPDVPDAVDAAVERALAVDPTSRPTARELAGLLGPALPAIDASARTHKRWRDAEDSGSGPSISPNAIATLSSIPSAPPPMSTLSGVPSTRFDEAPSLQHFVARDAELHALRDAWIAAQRGHGKIVVLRGEPGLGKSHLLARFVEQLRAQGATVLRSAFFDYEGSAPRAYGAFYDALHLRDTEERRPDDDVPAAPVDKWRTFQRIADGFARARGTSPLLVAFEDVHFARGADLELLLHLHRTLTAPSQGDGRLPTLVIATASPETGTDELRRWLAQLGQQRLLSIVDLAPFDVEAIRAWLVEGLGDVRIAPPDLRHLERATGGNPYFLYELVRHLIAQGKIRRDAGVWRCEALDGAALPPTLGSVVRAQLDALGADTRVVLDTASVIGDEFRFDTLLAATAAEQASAEQGGLDEDALDQHLERAVKKRLLVEEGVTGGNDYRFASDTIRRVVYEAMSPRRRRRLHRKVVEALHARYAGNLRPLARALCWHHHAVGDHAQALSFGSLAAEDDLHAHDVDRATASLRMAREAEASLRAAGTPIDPLDVARLDLLDGTLAARLGRHEHARASLSRVLSMNPPAPAGVRLEARLELANVHLGTGDVDGALEATSAAIGLARTQGDLARMQWARIQHASLLSRGGRVDDAFRELRDVTEELDETSSPTLRSFAYRSFAWECVKTGAFRDGEVHARKALELARRARDPYAEHQALGALASAFSEGGDSAAAIPFHREALAISRALSFRRREAIDLANIGESHFALGHHDEALARFSEALAIFVEIGDKACEGDCSVNVGRTLLAVGRTDEAIAILERGRDYCDATGRGEYAALARLHLGEALVSRGRSAEAIASLLEARDTFEAQRLHYLWSAEWALARARAADPSARGHAERAAEQLRELTVQLPPGADAAKSRASLAAIESFLATLP